MNKLCRLLRPCELLLSVAQHSVLRNIHVELCRKAWAVSFRCNFETIGVRTMAQKSITSFFKFTPKTATEVKEETPKKKTPASPSSSPNKSLEAEKSPSPTDGTEKRSSKRQRLASSGSDSQSPRAASAPVSPVDSDKKKKKKRLRIESSSSESEPQISQEKEIKVEKVETPKTYDSPKSKKSKSKVEKSPLTEKNVRASESPPSSKKTKQKTEDKKIKTERKSESPSTKKEKKAESKTINSFFTRKENGVSEKKDKTSVESDKDGDVKFPVSETEYNPSKAKYHPVWDACWAAGAEVPYLALARTLEAIEATSARLKIVDILANYFRSVIALTPEDLLPSVYLCLNQLAPAYHSLELGIAETYLLKAVGQCTGRTVSQLRVSARAAGDLGRVAEGARAAQRTMFTPQPLRLRQVFAALREIAHMTGHASVNKKISKIQTLYTACRHSEARYLIRSLEGKLRIGLAEQSVLQALAAAAALTPPAPGPRAPGEELLLDAAKGLTPEQVKALIDEHALLVKTTYCECPDYERVVGALLAHGARALPAHCRLAPGVPLKPMLAHPTKGLAEVFARFENDSFTCEWKYDGERAQIHVPCAPAEADLRGEAGARADCDRAAVFSRNQENNTSKYPDLVRRLPALLAPGVTSCVLDTEAVAYDTVNKKILPFQVLSTRKRKDAREGDITVQVCVFVFDLLYLNGRPLVRAPLSERRQLLREHFRQVEGEWQFATSKDCSSLEEVQQFLDESVRGSCEGLMVKTLTGDSARYDIARRSHNWLKLKKDYLDGVGDTIDAVVIGAWWGRGKRAGVLGGFLLACRDHDADELQALCKIGTGFSDEDLHSLTETLKEHIIDAPRSYYRFDPSHAAEVWVSAACVWEVRCADLSLSPAHRAAIGLVHPDKGISLRFPRFLRVRDDKSVEQATTAQQIADMYLAQDQVRNQAKPPANAARDDFY